MAVPAERAAIAALEALAAVVVPGRAVMVVWAWRALAAVVAMVATAAPAGMRAVSPTDQLVVMPERAALVARAELRARWA